jgi:hypothetical protein
MGDVVLFSSIRASHTKDSSPALLAESSSRADVISFDAFKVTRLLMRRLFTDLKPKHHAELRRRVLAATGLRVFPARRVMGFRAPLIGDLWADLVNDVAGPPTVRTKDGLRCWDRGYVAGPGKAVMFMATLRDGATALVEIPHTYAGVPESRSGKWVEGILASLGTSRRNKAPRGRRRAAVKR